MSSTQGSRAGTGEPPVTPEREGLLPLTLGADSPPESPTAVSVRGLFAGVLFRRPPPVEIPESPTRAPTHLLNPPAIAREGGRGVSRFARIDFNALPE